MKRYLPSIKQYSWILLVCLLFAAIVGYFIAKSLPSVYVVSSTILVQSGAPGTSITSLTSSSDPTLSLAQANTYATEIPSREVMKFVYGLHPEIEKHGYSVNDLLADVTATASTTSATVGVTATTTSPADSVILSNAVADGFVTYVQNQLQQELETQRNGLQTQVTVYQKQKSDLEGSLLKIGNTSDPRYALYSNDLQSVSHTLESLQGQLLQLPTTVRSDASVLQHGTLADVTSTSKTSLIVAATAGVGLIVGILIMLLMIFLDDRLRGDDQVKEKLGLAYLGGLAKDNGLKAVPVQAQGTALQEIADISANLRLTGVLSGQCVAPQGGVLLVTSTRTAECKTTVVAALASNVARGGGSVVVIDANLRRPSTHLAFGMSPAGLGLSGLLKSSGNVVDAVQRSTTPGDWLLPAGVAMEDPTLLLDQKFPAILEQLRKKTDMVIIDGPSLLSEADATLLARMVDSVVLVVDVRHNKLPLLLRAKELLATLTNTPVGIILNQVSARKRDRYFATAYPVKETEVSEKSTHEQGLSSRNGHDITYGQSLDGMAATPGGKLASPQRYTSTPDPLFVPVLPDVPATPFGHPVSSSMYQAPESPSTRPIPPQRVEGNLVPPLRNGRDE